MNNDDLQYLTDVMIEHKIKLLADQRMAELQSSLVDDQVEDMVKIIARNEVDGATAYREMKAGRLGRLWALVSFPCRYFRRKVK